MSRTRTLADMIADVRQRANLETSTFVTDDEIAEYLNQELAELHTRLTQGGGQPYFRNERDIVVSAGTSMYALPSDFWVLQGIQATIDGLTGPLFPFMPIERPRLMNAQSPWGRNSPVKYRLQADNLELLPALYNFTATIFYTPSCPRLTDALDTFDGFNGYEVAAIYGATATCNHKEGQDPSFYEGRKARIYKQIDELASARDMANPDRVQDVMGGLYDDMLNGEPFGR